MPLTLTLAGGSGGRDTRTLAHGTLSIGRAAGNDWVLPDPERQLSKTHCVIAAVGGRYLLTDLSTNGVFVNGAAERVPRNGEIELTDGDEIRLGEYAITVTETGAATDRGPPLVAGHAPPLVAGVSRPDPLASAGAATPDPLGSDPFDDVFGAPARPDFAHPIAAPPPALRGEDPFDVAEEAKRAPLIDPDDELFRGLTPAESWQGPSQPDNVDAPLHVIAAPKPLVPVNFDELDIDALLGDTPPGQGSPAAAPATPVKPAAVSPVSPAPVSPPAASPPRPAVSAPPAADAGRLLAAFLESAGVAGLVPNADPEAALRAAGEVFRVMVEGLRQVLISRAAVKNEFRVEQTMLRARDNNVLKFSVTTEDAVAALLQPGKPGYMPPLEAAREAFDDVRSHEMAVMAGVQTALVSLLKRFEPGALERRLQPGVLDNILPAARKARYWELFCDTYKEIAREAEDDFQSVFGREFARAYAAQMRKL
jgi:type VI secretion system FHA domain protein